MKEGRSLKAVKVAKDYPVRVRYLEEDDNDTSRRSLKTWCGPTR